MKQKNLFLEEPCNKEPSNEESLNQEPGTVSDDTLISEEQQPWVSGSDKLTGDKNRGEQSIGYLGSQLVAQRDIQSDTTNANWITLDLPDATIRYLTNFLTSDEADAYFEALQNELMWRQDEITIYGKTFLTPRLQAWYGDPESSYHYSSMSLHPLSWTINLLALKRRCEQAAQTTFNSVLGNWYRDGNDSMGMHADDERELGKTPVIAALSLGEARALKFRHKKGLAKVDLPLPHGSLMVMSGCTQAHWHHGISKTKKPVGDRISLTFRHIFPN